MTSIETKLPKDAAELKALLLKHRATAAEQQVEIDSLREEIRELQAKALKFQDLYFGRSSEKSRPTGSPEDRRQIPLFQADLLAEAQQATEANNVSSAMSCSPGKPPRKGGRQSKYPAHLPRVETRYELNEEDKRCTCGCEMHLMGFETSKELERIETTIVHTIKRAKYSCRQCGTSMKTAPGPFRPFEGALLGTGFMSNILVERFGNHMPFHRLERKYQREGLAISRNTLERTSARCAARLAPLVELLREKILSSGVIFTDDTPVTIARSAEPSKGGSRTGRMWVYLDKAGNHVYDFTRDRKAERATTWLDQYRGFIHADAYSGYDALFESEDVTEVACWAHCRRYFKNAEDSEPDLAATILSQIRDLYLIERAAKDAELGPDAVAAFRREKAMPILKDLRAQLDLAEASALPKSPMGKAIRYALNQWDALQTYLSDGRLEIDNNAAERAMRPIAVGRKGWMFFLNEGGGENAAVLFSLITTALAAEVNPVDYLRDVLVRIDFEKDWTKLLPHAWKENFEGEVALRRMAAVRELTLPR